MQFSVYMCICVYVCVCVCTCRYMFLYVYICVSVYMYIDPKNMFFTGRPMDTLSQDRPNLAHWA